MSLMSAEITNTPSPIPTPAPPPARVSLYDRLAWRDAAAIWLGQRLLFALITYLGVTLTRIPSFSQQRISWGALFAPWLGWDGANYAAIARYGYTLPWTPAYFPLLPALERALGQLTASDYALAGAIITNIACFFSFGLFRILAERELDLPTARRALLYLAIFPTAFFLAAPYTESLLLLFSLGAFLALRSGHWLLAGALAALATLSRSVGILLLLPILIEFWLRLRATRQPPRLRSLLALGASMLPPLAALAGFMLYIHALFGTFSATSQAETNGWGRGFALPFIGFARATAALIRDGLTPNTFQVHALLDIAFTLLFIALALATYRRLHPTYVAYALASLLLILCNPAHNWYALSSTMRYMLVVFPIFLLLGRWGANQRLDRLILLIALPLLTLFLLTFVIRAWIA